MSRSTAGLGRELGLNSQETNILLRDAGYLEGEPGDWRLTEKGQEHADQRHWDVPSSMHAGYLTTRWDDEVLEDLGEVSPERKREIDDEITTRRAEQRRQREERQAELENLADDDLDDSDYAEDEVEIDGKTVGAFIGGALAGIVLAKVAEWAKPHVEKWWDETGHPKLIAAKGWVVAKIKRSADAQQEEAASDNPDVETIEETDEKDEGEKN